MSDVVLLQIRIKLSEKMMKVEEEKKYLMNEKEFFRQELLNWKYQWINEGK